MVDPWLDADELPRARLCLAVADAVKSDTAANDKAAPVPATVSACESLRAKQPDGAVVVCDLKGEPSAAARVTLKRGAASSIAVTLHKAESAPGRASNARNSGVRSGAVVQARVWGVLLDTAPTVPDPGCTCSLRRAAVTLRACGTAPCSRR